MNYNHSGGQKPPSLEEVLQDLQKKFEKFLSGGPKSDGKFFLSIFSIALLAWGAITSFYTVQPDEEAIVIRFGKYQATYPPGLHFKIPFGVDQAVKLKTKLVHQEEFGFRTKDISSSRSEYSKRNLRHESSMLTGDLNVADVEWVLQYQIADPFKYMFQASEPIRNLRDVSESIMRRVVGDRTVTEVLTTGRLEIANDAELLIQEVLNKYDIGIRVVAVKLQDINPPDSVKPSFNEVVAAKQEQEQLINQAERAYNKVIPEARGKAEERIAQAEGYAVARVNRAKGDTDRFTAVLREYRRAPVVTRKRIYLETMEDMFKRFENVTIVDSDLKGLLPVFTNRSATDSILNSSQAASSKGGQ